MLIGETTEANDESVNNMTQQEAYDCSYLWNRSTSDEFAPLPPPLPTNDDAPPPLVDDTDAPPPLVWEDTPPPPKTKSPEVGQWVPPPPAGDT